jgi:hypothetical protein
MINNSSRFPLLHHKLAKGTRIYRYVDKCPTEAAGNEYGKNGCKKTRHLMNFLMLLK